MKVRIKVSEIFKQTNGCVPSEEYVELEATPVEEECKHRSTHGIASLNGGFEQCNDCMKVLQFTYQSPKSERLYDWNKPLTSYPECLNNEFDNIYAAINELRKR